MDNSFFLLIFALKEIAIDTKISRENIILNTKKWLERAVIGLNLCPFAKSVYAKQQIFFVVSDAFDVESLALELRQQLEYLSATDPEVVDTILLIHPEVLNNFLDYNDFLDLADQILEMGGWSGEIQIASFHPGYRFEGTRANAIENYTNRSPYPMLHLLRESSIDRAVAAFPNAEEIYEKNIVAMKLLGLNGWNKLFNDDLTAPSAGGADEELS
jgi:hypothetical protein